MAGGQVQSSLSLGRRSRSWTQSSMFTWWPGYRHWLDLLNRCRSGNSTQIFLLYVFLVAFLVFFFIFTSVLNCTQTGTQGSGISSCRWGVDQRKGSHEVIEMITLVVKSTLISIEIIWNWPNSILMVWMFFFRPQTKDIFNAQFGSLFRTYHNPTYFSRRLSRFADIYMASISCLLDYDFQHTFFPRRTPLQHESPFWPEHSPAGLDVSSQLHRTKEREEDRVQK